MEEQQDLKSEWNIDDAILKAIYALKIQFLEQISAWKLERAYWTLASIDSEINPAMKEEDQKTLNDGLSSLELARRKLNKDMEGQFYVLLIKTYKDMNRLMIESGWYFRKKEMYMGL